MVRRWMIGEAFSIIVFDRVCPSDYIPHNELIAECASSAGANNKIDIG